MEQKGNILLPLSESPKGYDMIHFPIVHLFFVDFTLRTGTADYRMSYR